MEALRAGVVRSADPQVKDELRTELIARGDFAELPNVTQLLLSGAVLENQKARFLYVIGNSIKSPDALPALLPLLNSPAPLLRTAAAEALWHIADPATSSVLVQHLHDASYDVRYYAVRGLADITGQNLWGPSIAEFQEHEGKYIEHWVDWGRQNGLVR